MLAFETFELELALQSCAFWVFGFAFLTFFFRKSAELVFSSMPPAAAFIPAAFPHANPAGDAVPFELALTEAPTQHVQAFMAFRGVPGWTLAGGGLDAAAVECARYKGELFDAKVTQWEKDHFELRLPHLAFPFPDKHWNGWAGFWLETGPYKRGCYCGNLTLGVEHLLCGLALPLLFLHTGDPRYFAWSLYGDIGANCVSNALIAASYATGENLLLEKYSRPLWHLLTTHHVCAIAMCVLGLYFGEDTPRDVACLLLVALLGTTGAMHLFSVALDLTPWSMGDAPLFRFGFQLATLLSMLWFRVVYWAVLCYQVVAAAYDKSGAATASLTSLILLVFSAFNADFVGFHVKATSGSWKKMQKANKAGKSE